MSLWSLFSTFSGLLCTFFLYCMFSNKAVFHFKNSFACSKTFLTLPSSKDGFWIKTFLIQSLLTRGVARVSQRHEMESSSSSSSSWVILEVKQWRSLLSILPMESWVIKTFIQSCKMQKRPFLFKNLFQHAK